MGKHYEFWIHPLFATENPTICLIYELKKNDTCTTADFFFPPEQANCTFRICHLIEKIADSPLCMWFKSGGTGFFTVFRGHNCAQWIHIWGESGHKGTSCSPYLHCQWTYIHIIVCLADWPQLCLPHLEFCPEGAVLFHGLRILLPPLCLSRALVRWDNLLTSLQCP